MVRRGTIGLLPFARPASDRSTEVGILPEFMPAGARLTQFKRRNGNASGAPFNCRFSRTAGCESIAGKSGLVPCRNPGTERCGANGHDRRRAGADQAEPGQADPLPHR